MWNLMASNRILDLKWKKQAQQKHKRNLRNIKSQTNTSAPKKFVFLDNKAKTRQIQLQRQLEIETNNSMLVGKMINTTSYIKRNPGYFKQSLNSVYCKKQEKDIDESNQLLVKRLQNTNSQYSQRNMLKERKLYNKVKTNIAYSRMDPFYDLDSGRQFSAPLDNYFGKRRPYSAKK